MNCSGFTYSFPFQEVGGPVQTTASTLTFTIAILIQLAALNLSLKKGAKKWLDFSFVSWKPLQAVKKDSGQDLNPTWPAEASLRFTWSEDGRYRILVPLASALTRPVWCVETSLVACHLKPWLAPEAAMRYNVVLVSGWMEPPCCKFKQRLSVFLNVISKIFEASGIYHEDSRIIASFSYL